MKERGELSEELLHKEKTILAYHKDRWENPTKPYALEIEQQGYRVP